MPSPTLQGMGRLQLFAIISFFFGGDEAPDLFWKTTDESGLLISGRIDRKDFAPHDTGWLRWPKALAYNHLDNLAAQVDLWLDGLSEELKLLLCRSTPPEEVIDRRGLKLIGFNIRKGDSVDKKHEVLIITPAWV